ncbi:MAG: 23S rRNA (adenine(2503)-C(2))-methyltransferase RlmN [Clostridia bacterium]|nr:23S rRNA (adenine(2503)-C(2))-methyltransferase RlmN [Clostridia bacterium]
MLIKKDIRSLNLAEISEDFKNMGEPGFRAKQVYKWVASGCESFSDMSNISKPLREKLEEIYFIPTVKIVKKLTSKLDETVKYLYELHDGERIESVLMKYNHGYTVCISTQVGCRMGCSFCASGLGGLYRNLLPSEMLAQVMMAGKDNNIRVSNIVLMGMGEPLDNFDNVKKFLELVSDSEGLGIGYRHISLSTSGVVPGIYKLAELNLPITLSISLHAPFDNIRSDMMKVNKRWNIEELLKACKDYQSVTGRRISFEYAMIKGKNDTDACANQLAKILRGILCHVNLIPVNPVKENTYEKSERKALEQFASKLNGLGINTTVRRTLGGDIDASCGQLRRKFEEKGGDTNEHLQ